MAYGWSKYAFSNIPLNFKNSFILYNLEASNNFFYRISLFHIIFFYFKQFSYGMIFQKYFAFLHEYNVKYLITKKNIDKEKLFSTTTLTNIYLQI